MVVDCRSLIQFCRAFEQRKNKPKPKPKKTFKRHKSLNPLSHPFCEHSPFAAIDLALLLLVLGALTVLIIPHFKFVFNGVYVIYPLVMEVTYQVVNHAPVAYIVVFILTFVTTVATWGVVIHQIRKCENPYCKGLKKAVEFDIQLESEDCLRYSQSVENDLYGARSLELGEDHKELEAELKKMAPLNGRTVLIFHAPCGCSAGRMEVWGAKKARRIKK